MTRNDVNRYRFVSWGFVANGQLHYNPPIVGKDESSRVWSYSVQVNVSARHGHLKQEDQLLISEKAEKVRKFYDRINSIAVVVDLEHADKPHVEVNVSAEGTEDFVATATALTVLAALDGAIHKVEQQVRKHKDKVTEHKGVGLKHSGEVQE